MQPVVGVAREVHLLSTRCKAPEMANTEAPYKFTKMPFAVDDECIPFLFSNTSRAAAMRSASSSSSMFSSGCSSRCPRW